MVVVTSSSHLGKRGGQGGGGGRENCGRRILTRRRPRRKGPTRRNTDASPGKTCLHWIGFSVAHEIWDDQSGMEEASDVRGRVCAFFFGGGGGDGLLVVFVDRSP